MSDSVKDIRDIRDPKAIGEKLLGFRELAPGNQNTLAELYTILFEWEHFNVPNYEGQTLGQITAQEYLDELQSRTDRYAASTLEAIRAGQKPINDFGGE